MKHKIAELTTQADAVIYFIKKMDVEMVDTLLDNDYTYQNMPKDVFINKLTETIQSFEYAGDDYLEAFRGCCKGCHYSCKGYAFIGNNSGNYLNLIIEIKKGQVVDIYDCALFKTDIPVERKQRIRIDGKDGEDSFNIIE